MSASVVLARLELLNAAVEVLAAERRLADDRASVTRLQAAEDAMSIAARDLTNAIDDEPPHRRPSGWALS